MPFEKRHQEIIKRMRPISSARLWANTFIFSAAIFVAGNFYLFVRRGSINIFANEASYNIFIANKILASTALILIGLSLALSGLCYFWDFVDTKIIYRKYLGIIGLWYGIAHVLVTVFFLSDRFPISEYAQTPRLALAAGSGILALILLIYLAAISNKYAAMELGSKKWRAMLRYGGYLAFLLITIHLVILKYEGWIEWFQTFKPILPPSSLLIVIFVLAVFILRFSLWIAVKKKQKNII